MDSIKAIIRNRNQIIGVLDPEKVNLKGKLTNNSSKLRGTLTQDKFNLSGTLTENNKKLVGVLTENETKLVGTLTADNLSLVGIMDAVRVYPVIPTQEKTAVSSLVLQEVVPDQGLKLSKVTIKALPVERVMNEKGGYTITIGGSNGE